MTPKRDQGRRSCRPIRMLEAIDGLAIDAADQAIAGTWATPAARISRAERPTSGLAAERDRAMACRPQAGDAPRRARSGRCRRRRQCRRSRRPGRRRKRPRSAGRRRSSRAQRSRDLEHGLAGAGLDAAGGRNSPMRPTIIWTSSDLLSPAVGRVATSLPWRRTVTVSETSITSSR